MSPPLSSSLHNKKECEEVFTTMATQEKKSGELVEISRAKLYVMQVFAWFMKNHNLVANLLVTLIFIHEFFNCKKSVWSRFIYYICESIYLNEK